MNDLTGGIWRYEILWKGKNILPTKMGEIKRNLDISKKFGSVEGNFFLFLFSFHHGILGFWGFGQGSGDEHSST